MIRIEGMNYADILAAHTQGEIAMRYVFAKVGSCTGLLFSSAAAIAGNVDGSTQLAEPGIIELLAIAAVVGLVVKLRRGRK